LQSCAVAGSSEPFRYFEVDGLEAENPWLVDDARAAFGALLAENQQLRKVLEWIEPQQQQALAMIERNGFVFEDIGNEPGNWQHLAFTLYSKLCEIDSVARAAVGEE
jgi:hypothetical protein